MTHSRIAPDPGLDIALGYRVGAGALAARGLPALFRLLAAERWRPSRLRDEEDRRLRRVVQHAARRSPYYRDLFREHGVDPSSIRTVGDLRRLPVLDKAAARAAGAALYSDDSWPERRDRLSAVLTSGATGAPLRVVVDRGEAAESLAAIFYGFLRCGVRPGDRLAYLWTPTPAQPRGVGAGRGALREARFDLRRGPADCLDDVAAQRPHAIYGFPSFLALMAEENLVRPRAGVRPRVVVTHGETLTAPVRGLIETGFGCAVRNTYGSAEFNRLAFECERGFLHLVPLVAALEVEGPDPESGVGEAIVTSFVHRTMPFLRYRLGDRLAISTRSCACGRALACIERVEGRSDDYLVLPSGRRVTPRAVNLIEEAPGVLEHQIVQRRRDFVEVLVRPLAGASPDAALIRRIVADGCQGESVEIRVSIVGEIPRGAGGKLRAVISEVQ